MFWPAIGRRLKQETRPPPPAEPEADASASGRVRLAVSADSPTTVLRELARDPEIIVRAAVAINGQCCPETDSVLASDDDERVRALLGSRIARLLPDLSGDEHGTATTHVHRTLAALARDHAIRVRAAIAQEIKTMVAAPHDLVLLLARDAAVEVSGPIVRLSPVLTDADLLTLLATPPHPGAAESIASRPSLSAAVADAIAAHADAPAIRALLANASACIKEATLDALVGRAAQNPDWHAPLVYRPQLSAKAIRTLSQIIATDLLRVLATRTDLQPAMLDAIYHRIAAGSAARDESRLIAEADRLKAHQQLTESVLLEAAWAGDLRRVAAVLAVASGFKLQAVDRIVSLRSAKALVSVVWRSGFSMRAAMAVQTVLGQFGPDQTLQPAADGGFPLSPVEMEWQLELMSCLGQDADGFGLSGSADACAPA